MPRRKAFVILVFVMSSRRLCRCGKRFSYPKTGDLPDISAPGFLNGLTALANATVNGFRWSWLAAPATARSSTYSKVLWRAGPNECGKTVCQSSISLNQPQDLGIALARAIRVSVSVALAEFILICQQMSWPRRWKRRSVNHDCKSWKSVASIIASPKSVASAISLLAKAERPLVSLAKARRIHKLMNSFVNLLKCPDSIPANVYGERDPRRYASLSAAAARSFALANADVVMLLVHDWIGYWHTVKKDGRQIQVYSTGYWTAGNWQQPPHCCAVVGDIASSMQGMLAELKQNHLRLHWYGAIF